MTSGASRATILACATAELPHRYRSREIEPFIASWLADDAELCEKALRILSSTGIERRAAAVPLEDVFRPRRFEERNRTYIECAVEIGERVLSQALAAARVAAADLDLIIAVSCTGYMIPSLDAWLVNRLGMKQTIQRLPVLQMGCAAGAAALIYAADFLESHQGARAAVVSVELPSLTLRLDDRSMANVVSAALFADGAAAVVLGEGDLPGARILGRRMYHFPDATALMGYELCDSGFRIVLDREVPAAIEKHFDRILFPFLDACGVRLEEIREFIFHPGSGRILGMAAEILARHGKELDDSHSVLREYGNMSSATVLHILERALGRVRNVRERGTLALMLAFGPGFTAQTLLLGMEPRAVGPLPRGAPRT